MALMQSFPNVVGINRREVGSESDRTGRSFGKSLANEYEWSKVKQMTKDDVKSVPVTFVGV